MALFLRLALVVALTLSVHAEIDASPNADTPPIFSTPDKVDFGEMTVGAAVKREMTVENQGSGTIEGTLDVDKPWEIAGRAHYRLGPGAKETFVLGFTAGSVGEFNGEAKYSDYPERVTALHASVKAPFSVLPALLGLRAEKDDAVRSGCLEIANGTGEVETIKIDLPARLQGPGRVELAAGGKKIVMVKTAPDDLQPIEESIRLSTPLWGMALPVRAPVVGPILRAVPDSVSFGETVAGNDFTTSFTIKNVGGSRANVTLSAPPPFRIDDGSFPLEPGAEKAVTVELEADEPGNFEKSIRVDGGGGFDIRVRAKVAAVEAKGAPQPAAVVVNEPERSQSAPVSPVRRIASVRITRIGSTSCQADWIAPEPGNLRYQLEARNISLDAQGNLRVVWLPLRDVSYTNSGDEVIASVKGLVPAFPYGFRARSIDAKGVRSRPSQPVYFVTAPAWHPRATPLGALFVALAVLVAGVIRQRYFARDREPLP